MMKIVPSIMIIIPRIRDRKTERDKKRERKREREFNEWNIMLQLTVP